MEVPALINPSNGDPVFNWAVRDKSKMPITNVTNIMDQILPNHAKVSYSAMEMIQQSATQYINFVTGKAKERCQSEYRKIMNVEDMIWAIEKLGFNDYVGPLTTFVQRYRNIGGADQGKPIPHTENHGPRFGPNPNLMCTLETIHSPSPPPPPESYSSMDPNTILEMFDPDDFNEFYLGGFGVGCSNDHFDNFDASAFFKDDQV